MKNVSLNQNNFPDKKEFPLGMFVISYLATVFSGWQSCRLHYRFEEMSTRHIALIRHVGRIMLLDDVLTIRTDAKKVVYIHDRLLQKLTRFSFHCAQNAKFYKSYYPLMQEYPQLKCLLVLANSP